VGSNGGRAAEPSWSLNIRADPSVEVQAGAHQSQVDAELLEGSKRQAAWQAFTSVFLDYAKAQTWAGRELPLFRLPKPAGRRSTKASK
jgi:deazaflavin-dependent oxidoreductase (nitroreductase family)